MLDVIVFHNDSLEKLHTWRKRDRISKRIMETDFKTIVVTSTFITGILLHDNGKISWWHHRDIWPSVWKNTFLDTGPLWRDPSIIGGFPSQGASDVGLWCFLWCYLYKLFNKQSSGNCYYKRAAGPRLNIKTVLSTYGDFHVKDKTAVRTSYL